MSGRPRSRWTPAAAALLLAATIFPGLHASAAAEPAPGPCKGTIYLSFDTGSQSQAELIADTLRRHHIKATFFLANEKTVRGDWSLDPSWAAFWKARVAEGHAFGSHTFDHVYWKRDEPGGRIAVKPQFGAQAGKLASWTPQQYCDELNRVDTRFHELTGHHIDPIFRAPGGHTSPNLLAAAKSCGYSHVGWAKAGFSGDETSSEVYPNALLLKRALGALRDGDIFMAHMGIWSRKDPWAPANLEPLIAGLEQKGFCFATLREHPDYLNRFKK
ncbi:polysaccharide deacetylase family protein [Massilia sp. 2TAF26]|uniref:polysaccharide deacetylase family protein n=1 Tax=Massilia sp. 2TAF26 TaxID=3233012 RepID=UPI003F963419